MQPGTIAYAAGWGAIIPDDQLGPLAFLIPKEQKRPKVLQVVDVPLIENPECEVWHERAGITVKLYPEMMCAGYRDGGKDSKLRSNATCVEQACSLQARWLRLFFF